jgi:Immunoglobulin-like domain of bacterial spore germination
MRLRALMLCAALGACAPAAERPESPPPAAEIAVPGPNEGLATVDAPLANARVTSPLVVTGTAPANWIFEAQFNAYLHGPGGYVLVQAPAISQDDWTNGNPTHPFRAELAFTVTEDTPAVLVLQEDMAQDHLTPRQVSVPVVLTPN